MAKLATVGKLTEVAWRLVYFCIHLISNKTKYLFSVLLFTLLIYGLSFRQYHIFIIINTGCHTVKKNNTKTDSHKPKAQL